MIQYKIYETPLPPAWVLEALIKYTLVAEDAREDWCNKYISNLKEIASIELDTGHMQEWFLIPTRIRILK